VAGVSRGSIGTELPSVTRFPLEESDVGRPPPHARGADVRGRVEAGVSLRRGAARVRLLPVRRALLWSAETVWVVRLSKPPGAGDRSPICGGGSDCSRPARGPDRVTRRREGGGLGRVACGPARVQFVIGGDHRDDVRGEVALPCGFGARKHVRACTYDHPRHTHGRNVRGVFEGQSRTLPLRGVGGNVRGGEPGRPLHVAIATSPALEHRLAAAPCTLCAVDSSRTVRCAVRDVRSGLHAGDARGSRLWRAGEVTGRRTMGRVTGRRPVEAGCTRVGEAKARRR
jgi:hypothetical protein